MAKMMTALSRGAVDMFWRLVEYLFLTVTAFFGMRFVYLLWVGPEKHRAKAGLEDAREDAEVSELERKADKVRSQTKTRESRNDV